MSSELRILGKYALQKRLGHGGMGEVWKAFDTQLQRHVAIKVLHDDWQMDPEFVTRFTREAQFIASLHHPNIVQIHDFQIAYPPDVEASMAYMVMDYVEGQTLGDFIRRTSRKSNFPSAQDIIYIFTGISLAIDYAHKRGMVHRDIKPANILLDSRPPVTNPLGKPVLIDFGIARLQTAHTGTQVGTLLGTPHYISPEQARGKHGNPSSDLYSLGIILYEIATGLTPFRGETTMSILMQHMQSAPTPPELINQRITTELSDVILKSISKQPEDRYQSARELTIAAAEAMHVPIPRQLLSSAPPAISNTSSSSLPSTGLSLSPSLPLTPSGPTLQPLTPSGPPSPPLTPSGPPSLAGTGSMNWPMAIQNAQNAPKNNPVSSDGSLFGMSPAPLAASQQLAPTSSMHGQVPPQPIIISQAPPVQRPKSRRRTFILLALLSLVIVVSSVAAWAFFLHPQTATTSGPVGQVHFINSGHVAPGNYDEVQIDLTNIPNPPQGQTYYAWIESGSAEQFMPHWQLIPQNGIVHANNLTYPNHSNLLQPDTFLLITRENSGQDPPVPTTDPKAHLYYAQLTPLSETTFTISPCSARDPSYICLQ
jgi:serine/threonine protein kinase